MSRGIQRREEENAEACASHLGAVADLHTESKRHAEVNVSPSMSVPLAGSDGHKDDNLINGVEVDEDPDMDYLEEEPDVPPNDLAEFRSRMEAMSVLPNSERWRSLWKQHAEARLEYYNPPAYAEYCRRKGQGGPMPTATSASEEPLTAHDVYDLEDGEEEAAPCPVTGPLPPPSSSWPVHVFDLCSSSAARRRPRGKRPARVRQSGCARAARARALR